MSQSEGTFLSEENLQVVLETLVERNDGRDERLNFPEKSYALGGAGKSLIFELLETEWFLIELLLDRNRSTTEFHIIDTETESKTSEQDRVKNIDRRIRTIETLLEENHDITDTPRIRIRQSHLTDDLKVGRISDFIGPDVVEDVLTHSKDPNADTWWIDRETLLDNGGDMHNLSKGAIRRRSLSKAFYYKAQSETQFEPKHLDLLSDDGQVAVFAGLGGGTGSGMFIDLARAVRRKRDNVRITFFGILPAKPEGKNERANAYAALSELEYFALGTEQNDLGDEQFPFTDVVLTPIDPTDHKSSVDHNPKLENFDTAYPYVPISYYNNQNLDQAFENNSPYAPFTVAIPQLLRYNVQRIREARQQAETVLEQKASALAAERELHEEIQQHLTEHHDVTEGNRLSAEDASLVEGRINDLLDFVADGTFSDSAVSRYIEHVFGDDPRSKKLDTLIEDIEFALGEGGEWVDDTPTTSPYIEDDDQGRPDELDETARERINEELQCIKSMHKILALKREVKHEEIRNLIDFFLDTDVGNEKARKVDQRLSSVLSELGDPEKKRENGRIQRKRDQLESLKQRREERRREQQDEINMIVDDWANDNCRRAVNRLHELESIEVNAELEKLRNELQGFTQQIQNAEGAEIDRIGSDISDTLDEIANKLPEKDRQNFETDRNRITNAIIDVQNARKSYLTANNKNLFERIKGIFLDDDSQGEYEQNALQVNDQRVFQIPLDLESDFRVNMQYQPSITSEIEAEKQKVRDHLEREFKETLDSKAGVSAIPSEVTTEYLNKLEIDDPSRISPRELLAELKDDVRSVVEDAVADIGDLNQEIEQANTQLAQMEAKRQTFEAAYELFQNVATDVQEYKKGQSAFQTHLDEPFADLRGTDDEDAVYASIRTPDNIADTTGSGSLSDSDLLSRDGTEVSDVEDYFLDCVEDRFLNQSYNGLQNREFETPDGTRSFTDTRLCVALAGDIFTDDADENREQLFNDAIHSLRQNLGVRQQDDDFWRWTVRNGGLWDVSMCVFLQGITFFENLEPVISRNRGYVGAYRERVDEKSMSQKIQRHAYGLERGFFVQRADHYPITQADNQRTFITETSDDLVDMLFNSYELTEFEDLHTQKSKDRLDDKVDPTQEDR